MGGRWSIEEIWIRLPIINVKLKASAESKKSPEQSLPITALDPSLGIKVGLKSFNGSFVGADLNRNGELVASVPEMKAWETFDLFKLPDGKASLRACNGKYVGAKLHEHGQLVADRPEINDWEMFKLSQLRDGKFAFCAFNNLYVSADLNRNGELVADRPEASGWEAFTLTLAG